ncbi:MAG: NAD(P)/FAD-dependent oxidoreductase [Myxococcota bacterium]|nr:NAD(P)/FAD-dependent oxidoreductase [Myxococcota bacterium]
MTSNTDQSFRVAIIGAGPGGLCMAIHLKQAGIEDFVILEKSSGVGGTWNHNRYPGCACDIPAPLYSYSFELNPEWSGLYPPQPEILAYFEHCAKKYELLEHCRFDDSVLRATWDDSAERWTTDLESGRSIDSQFVISALGMFNELNYPEIPGLDDFQGACFHSARWDWNCDLTHKKVAVVGSAASAVQFVPEIAKTAASVDLFQRTANWVLPKEDAPFPSEQLEYFKNNPDAPRGARDEIHNVTDAGGAGAFEAIREEMEAACLTNLDLVESPETRKRLLPDHPWGCKRPLLSNHYYPAFNRPNLELVTDPIGKISENSVIMVDGTERRADVLVLATGFQTTLFLSAIKVSGRKGLRLEEAWRDGAQAYKGVMTSGFPNLFMLYGPNTNGDSIITTIEYEVEFAVRQIRRLIEQGSASIDVRAESMTAYNETLQEAIRAIAPWQSDCGDYYRSASGRVVTQWPHRMSELKQQLEAADEESYLVSE